VPRKPTGRVPGPRHAAADPEPRWERPARRGPPRPVLLAAGAAVVAVLVALVVVLGGGGGSPEKSAGGSTPRNAPPPAAGAPVVRSDVTVSVLNGTTVPGLAAQVADEIERGGFKRGAVTNAADQQRASTVISYAPNYLTAAQEVGALLKVSSIAPIDQGTQAIAGPDADVVVTVGTDRTP